MGKIYDFFSGGNKPGKGVTKKQVEFDAEGYELSDLSIVATRNELEKDLQ